MKACSLGGSGSGLREKGYVLLVLLLSVALLSMGLLVLVERIDFQIKRDREEEMIHRGVQYSRAVRNFINTFHRYPNSIEELEETNNLHFLRRRYKDPLTGKDFKILHLTDMPSFISTPRPGVSSPIPASQQPSSGALNSAGSNSFDASASGVASAQSSDTNDQVDDSQSNRGTRGDVSQGDQNGSSVAAPSTSSSASQKSGPGSVSQAAGGAQGIVIGVASASKEKAIRAFNKKDHYNQWLFIYDPSTDHGGILTTPSQPPLQAAIQRNQQPNEQDSPPGLAANSGKTNAPTPSLIQDQQ